MADSRTDRMTATVIPLASACVQYWQTPDVACDAQDCHGLPCDWWAACARVLADAGAGGRAVLAWLMAHREAGPDEVRERVFPWLAFRPGWR